MVEPMLVSVLLLSETAVDLIKDPVGEFALKFSSTLKALDEEFIKSMLGNSSEEAEAEGTSLEVREGATFIINDSLAVISLDLDPNLASGAFDNDVEEDVDREEDDDFLSFIFSFSLLFSLFFFLCFDFSFFKDSNAGLITVGSPRIVGLG